MNTKNKKYGIYIYIYIHHALHKELCCLQNCDMAYNFIKCIQWTSLNINVSNFYSYKKVEANCLNTFLLIPYIE